MTLVTATILSWFWPSLTTAVIGWMMLELHTKVWPHIDTWLGAKAKSSKHAAFFETIKAIFDALTPAAELAAKATTQTFVDTMKGQKNWNAAIAEQAMAKSLTSAKQLVGPQVIQTMQDHGITDVDTAIKTLIEAALQNPQTVPTAAIPPAAVNATPASSSSVP